MASPDQSGDGSRQPLGDPLLSTTSSTIDAGSEPSSEPSVSNVSETVLSPPLTRQKVKTEAEDPLDDSCADPPTCLTGWSKCGVPVTRIKGERMATGSPLSPLCFADNEDKISKVSCDDDRERSLHADEHRGKTTRSLPPGKRQTQHNRSTAALKKQEEAVRLLGNKRKLIARRMREVRDDFTSPVFSVKYRDNGVKLSEDRLTATGHKGWSTALATNGADKGVWFFEATVLKAGHVKFIPDTQTASEVSVIQPRTSNQRSQGAYPSGDISDDTHSPEKNVDKELLVAADKQEFLLTKMRRGAQFEPHVRIGWGCRFSRYDVPIGHSRFSYAVRDVDGSVVTAGKRKPYMQCMIKEGDVIGCLLHLKAPKVFLPDPRTRPELHAFLEAGILCNPDKPPTPSPSIGSYITYMLNGVEHGHAFLDINSGAYHPAVSLFMGASISLNMGPQFEYPPQGDSIQFQPACYLPRPVFR